MKEWICGATEENSREWQFIAKQELVRCKDCAFHDSGENEVDAWNRCKLHKINTSDDEFCSWGVKRE